MIGLGSYAFFWEHSDRVAEPLSLVGALERTRELGIELFQICDFAPLDRMSDRDLADAARAARDLGLSVELGTKGISAEHLGRYLALAETFDARLVRTMLPAGGAGGSGGAGDAGGAGARADTIVTLRGILPSFEAAGVTLALETYEQVATADLAALVREVDSPRLGICLDPANVVARLEHPRTCVETAADVVVAVHVKDFAFARQPGWVGFTYSGAPLGTGLHDYAHLRDTVRPAERGINEVVEHWLPWQGDAETTVRTEREWTRITLEHLRSSQ